MRLVTLGAVTLALATTACGEKPAAAPTPAPSPTPVVTTPPIAAVADSLGAPADDAAAAATTPPTDAAVPDAVPDAVPETAPAVRRADTDAQKALEAKAKALVGTWLDAQNQAAFDAYAALYAPRFTGIKRSGARERTFALAGWLADRKGMFKHAMKVTADEVEVAISSATAIVTFTQTWASGTYEDKGKKQLVLVPRGDGLAIAREEMLASELQVGAATAKPVDPDLFTLAIPVGGGEPNAVIPTASIDPGWGTGQLTLIAKTGPTTVMQAVDPLKLPPELKAWLGKKVTTDQGCTSTIDRLSLVGRYVPHFGTVQMWNATDGAEPAGKPYSDAEIARDAWDSGGIAITLVGHLPGCTAGLWVRDAAKPAPVQYAKDADDAQLAAAALAEFRKLSGWKALQAEAKQADPPVTSPTWDVFDGAAPEVQSWTDTASGRRFVQVTADAGIGCGQFGGAFGAIFELKKGATETTFVLLTDPAGGPTEPVRGVVDLDGDGEVELYLDQGLIQRVGPIWQQTLDVTPPDFDCPC